MTLKDHEIRHTQEQLEELDRALEAEALVIHYRVATRRGFTGGFRSWARNSGANPSPVNDIVAVLRGTRDREPIERAVL